MKKPFALLLAFALMSVPLSASAKTKAEASVKAKAEKEEEFDLGKLTCEEFLEFDEDETDMVYMWFTGYAAAKSGSTVVDMNSWEKDIKKLQKICAAKKKSVVLKVLGF